jgi:predicted RNA-binding Zn ribbon-like protein
MSQDVPGEPALLVGDHLALDFINTEYGEADLHREVLQSDQAVLDWLRTVGLVEADGDADLAAPRGLLTLARKLRTNARALVEAARSGEEADPAVVNQVLGQGSRGTELRWNAELGAFEATRRAGRGDAAELLAPIAEALVELLATVDLALVRQCEGEHCTLLFRDLTKSHRRRWCSMASCGNRMKVAAFRARRSGA